MLSCFKVNVVDVSDNSCSFSGCINILRQKQAAHLCIVYIFYEDPGVCVPWIWACGPQNLVCGPVRMTNIPGVNGEVQIV